MLWRGTALTAPATPAGGFPTTLSGAGWREEYPAPTILTALESRATPALQAAQLAKSTRRSSRVQKYDFIGFTLYFLITILS